jgi:outer membrane protein OmpA-like peptidoglycan-associated protein
MKQTRVLVSFALFLAAGSVLCVAPAFAQPSEETGKLNVRVEPKQAYIFVDGKAVREGSHTIKLAAGDHKVDIQNYGYQPKTENVHIDAGQKANLNVILKPSGDKVPGPFADIEFKGDPRAAVLLNGQTPAYFVGHVDEFDWNWIWHQRLLVKPGTYQVTVRREGNAIWSGPVVAKAGQQVTVYLNRNGEMKTKEWKEGLTMSPQPRFHAGLASATVAIAPVTAQLSSQLNNLSCGQFTSLRWNAMNAVDTSISGLGPVNAQGDRSVTPKHDMTYVLTAKGPGGEATQTVTVDVDTRPTATLALSQPEVRYHKIGDKVIEQDSATLNWSASNANSATLEPIGSTSMNGSRTLTADPEQTHTGPVDRDTTYTFSVSNPCGGTTTKTAVLHVVGSIDPAPPVTLASVFYPTAFPTNKHPEVGLVASEKEVLAKLAKDFRNHQQYDRQARLRIVGHADVRGSEAYNQALSERRAALIRDYLESEGVPDDQVQMQAVGKDQQLSEEKVEALQSKDPEKPEKWEMRHQRTTWLAYNRRADVILEPKGQEPAEVYPNDVADARILWQDRKPRLKAVKMAEKGSTGVALAQTSASGR